jgi:hypothetical protein
MNSNTLDIYVYGTELQRANLQSAAASAGVPRLREARLQDAYQVVDVHAFVALVERCGCHVSQVFTSKDKERADEQ